jgi:hypothetical protein
LKRLLASLLPLAVALSAAAAEPKSDDKLTEMIRSSLPLCGPETKFKQEPFERKMPPNMTGTVVTIESPRAACAGQLLAITTAHSFYLGQPWFLDGLEGTTEARLKQFGWQNLQATFTPKIGTERTAEGMLPVELQETTEYGPLPLDGEIDPQGTMFLLGHFHSNSSDIRAERLKAFAPFVSSSPSRGPAGAAVSVIEFSDFECPSCRYAATHFKPMFDKYKDQIRFTRFDLPLVTNHPWAFAAALAGRAIYRQKPDAFWAYKEQIYENQDKLNSFLIDDFARNFAKDHELDLAKYDTDLADPSVRKSILGGVGAAFANDIRATPSYVVNGVIVDPGNDGAALDKYIADQLAAKK